MILVWDGSSILSIDLDREIPGPRAEAVARLIEPNYLRGYLEGRRKEAGRAMLRNRAALKGYRQIERLLRLPATLPPAGTARQYAEQLWNNHVTTSEQPVADTPST